MPAPKDPKQLKLFLGISYYSSFLPEMHTMRGPLDDLERQNCVHCRAPEGSRETQESAAVRSVVNELRPWTGHSRCCGVGAIISHHFQNSTKRQLYTTVDLPLRPRRTTFNRQIEKEALALGVSPLHL